MYLEKEAEAFWSLFCVTHTLSLNPVVHIHSRTPVSTAVTRQRELCICKAQPWDFCSVYQWRSYSTTFQNINYQADNVLQCYMIIQLLYPSSLHFHQCPQGLFKLLQLMRSYIMSLANEITAGFVLCFSTPAVPLSCLL